MSRRFLGRDGGGGRLNRALDVVEACLWLGLLAGGTAVALEVLRQEAGQAPRSAASRGPAPSGLIEAEDLNVMAQSRVFTFWLQPTADFVNGRWSKDGHMFAFGTQQGDWVDLELMALEPGRYQLEVFLTRASDYGIVAVSINGLPLGEEIDLWSYGVAPTGALDLGPVQLTGRGDVLRLEVIGSNPESSPPHFQFGIDGVRLRKLGDRVAGEDAPQRGEAGEDGTSAGAADRTREP